MDEIKKYVISNDDEALSFLKESLKNNLPDNVSVEFSNWPVFKLSIYGDDFHGTIPTRIMPPILDLQEEINRAYCRAKYGSESLRSLTDEERDALELVVEVNEGCTEFIAEIGKVFNDAIKASSMTGPETAIVFVSIGMFVAGAYGWKQWLLSRERMHQADVTVRMSQEETKRNEILADTIKHNSQVRAASEGINEFRTNLAKKLKPTDEVKHDGEFIVDGATASTIAKKPKEEPSATRIDGDFAILNIGFPEQFGEPYKLHVKRIKDNMRLTVEASHDVISHDQIETIKAAGFGVKVVALEINAQKRHDQISNAKLYNIKISTNNT